MEVGRSVAIASSRVGLAYNRGIRFGKHHSQRPEALASGARSPTHLCPMAAASEQTKVESAPAARLSRCSLCPGMSEVRITSIPEAGQTVMRLGRGITRHLVGPEHGARKVDMHINVLNPDAGMGPYHYHENAENVYLVLDGRVQVVIDGRLHELGKDAVVFIPPGVPHAAGSAGAKEAVLHEIIAPAGPDYLIGSDQPTGWNR